MLVTIVTASADDVPEDLVVSRIGQKLYASILRHPWYAKYVQPIGQDRVQWQVLVEDGFWRVQCGSDGQRLLRFDINQKLRRIVGVHLFKLRSGQWLYISSYGGE